MSKSARTDEIDALVSSVRDFVSQKEPRNAQPRKGADRLVLTPDQLVADTVETPAIVDKSTSGGTAELHLFEDAKRGGMANLESALSALEIAMESPNNGSPVHQQHLQPSVDEDAPHDDDSQEASENSPDQTEQTPETDAIGENPLAEQADDDTVDEKPTANLLAAVGADVMTQDALRAMIVEIVHEELTGELGERMTRNVRKLVRREINRVLASRELGQD